MSAVLSHITFSNRHTLEPEAVAELFGEAGLHGPLDDMARMRRMLENSQLVISAWDGERLVGVARTLTDFEYNAFIADLAVHPDYRGRGIGKQLIRRSIETGAGVDYVAHAAHAAESYYPDLGFETAENCWHLRRRF